MEQQFVTAQCVICGHIGEGNYLTWDKDGTQEGGHVCLGCYYTDERFKPYNSIF